MATATGNAARRRRPRRRSRSATTGASTPIERVMHALLMLTFVGCALTGLPLHLRRPRLGGDAGARILGGFEGAGADPPRSARS